MVKENVKIAQVVSTFPPYRGGMGNVAFHIADNLSQQRLRVTVFTPRRHFKDSDIKSYFVIHKMKPQFKFGNSAIVFQLLWRLLKFDIVHLHYPFLGASIGIILAKLIRGRKMKLVVHYHMDLVGRDWKSFIYKLYNFIFLKPILKTADVILATSEDYLETSLMAKFYKKHPQKFRILPNGVNIDYFRPKPKEIFLTDKYKLKDKKVILFVGALDSSHYFKGVNYLISAFKMLKQAEDYKLIIVGEGDLRSVYEQMVDSFGLRNEVIFTGYIPDEELLRYYNLCDLFVLPSIDKSEAFGMVLLEAMACAKPVIATDLPGVRQVVQNKVNGYLVKPKNAGHLAEKIELMMDNKAKYTKIGLHGREMVEMFYSWDIITERLIDIYGIKNENLPD